MNVLWLVGDQATTFGSTVFIKVSFHSRWFKQILLRTNPLLWYDFSVAVFFSFSFFPHYVTPPPPLSLVSPFLIFIFVAYILTQFSIPILYFQNCSFSFYFSPNSGFSFLRKFHMAFLSEKAFLSTCMHLSTKVGEKITGGWCLHSRRRFTCAHT